MSRARRVGMIVLTLAVIAVACSGCAYMKNRGNDALNMFDIGITFTEKPHFAVYAGFQSLLAVGYADLDGKLIGIGDGRAGCIDMRYHAAGSVLEGYEQYAYADNYKDDDPNSPTRRGIGLGLIYGGYPDTFIDALNCPKLVHVGWIGLDLNCKIGKVLDFIVGWTTLDLAGDDKY